MGETAIVIPCEVADPIIGPWRARHTPDGRDGMPAHITLLYPWVERFGEGDMAKVRGALSTFEAFDFSLPKIAEFPGLGSVVYLEPEPRLPFIMMIEAVAAAFPDHPPYGGAFEDIVPHATILETDPNSALEDEVTQALKPRLPILEHANQAWVVANRDGRWQTESEVDLASAH